jgi:hypothetical protein
VKIYEPEEDAKASAEAVAEIRACIGIEQPLHWFAAALKGNLDRLLRISPLVDFGQPVFGVTSLRRLS